MRDLDFLEIGTSDFDTCIEHASDTTKGISVEPIKFYIDRLPNPKNVKKVNAAISPTNSEKDSFMYYIPHETIIEKDLHFMLRGCNSLNKIHKKAVDLKLEHLVEKLPVKEIPISKLLIDNDVKKIDYLKIDADGCDTYILENLYHYLKDKSEEYLPKRIRFEHFDSITKREKMLEVVNLYIDLDYFVMYEEYDVELRRA